MPDAVTFHRYEHHMCIKAADHEIGHLGQEFMIAVHIEVLSSATRLAHRHPHEPQTCRNAFPQQHDLGEVNSCQQERRICRHSDLSVETRLL